MTYQVVGPLVIAKDRDRRPYHVYQGGIIQWLSDEQAKHFLDTGLVVKLGDSEPAAEAPEPVDEDSPPAKSAAKSEWVDYAVAQGYDRDEVEPMSKADIQALDFA